MAGLQRKTDKGEKYFVVRRDGTMPSWPKFVLGARDPAAPAALRAYANESLRLGLDAEYARDVIGLSDEFDNYRATHGAGKPDGEPDRTDNPEVVSMMTSRGVLWAAKAFTKLGVIRNQLSGLQGWVARTAEIAQTAIQELSVVADIARAAGVNQDFAFVATKDTPVTYGAVRSTSEWAVPPTDVATATDPRPLTERAMLLLEESLANPNYSSTRWQKLVRLLVDEWRTRPMPMESIIDIARSLSPSHQMTLAEHLPAVCAKFDQGAEAVYRLAKAEWVLEAIGDFRLGMKRLEEYRQTYKAEPPEVGTDGRVR